MPSSDWDDLTTDISWVTFAGDGVEVSPTRMASDGFFQPTPRFQETFPSLSHLLGLARVTVVKRNNDKYLLFGWTDLTGRSLGWQCLPPEPPTNLENVFPDHALILSCFGGIRERWHEPQSSWLLNLNHALTLKGISDGFNGWDDYYLDICKEDNISPPVNPAEYRTFAVEANGNCTMYHHVSGQILMFAHDHNFKYVRKLPGCPDYTLYTINNCPDFRAWVETLARQWTNYVHEPR